MKKPISFILVLCMVLAMMPAMSITASAATGDTFQADITVSGSAVSCTFKVLTEPVGATPGTVQIGNGTAAIPSTAAGVMTIPASITSGSATYNVTKIGDRAFDRNSNLTGTLIIPASVTEIGEYAFFNCEGLTGTLTIPASVTTIGENAFNYSYGRSKFSALQFESGSALTTIGDGAFYMNSSFTGPLILPASVTSIGDSAFSNCTSFSALQFESGSILTSIGAAAFASCNFTGSLTLPDSVDTIGTGAFANCKNFTGPLAFPASLTTIGNRVFYYCEKLTGPLTIPASITTIGTEAFYRCTSFSALQFAPGSVLTSIGGNAFVGCNFTGALTLPPSLETIGQGAFQNTLFNGTLTIPASVTSIGNYVFMNCAGFTELRFESGSALTMIGMSAFDSCSGLTGDLIIPDGVNVIHNSAFKKCTGFSGSLTLPSSATSIQNNAFTSCSGLTGTLTIPASVSAIFTSAFEGCSGFTALRFASGSALSSLGEKAFKGCAGLTGTLTLPASINGIYDSAFEGCGELTTLELQKNSLPSTIRTNAFKDCGKLAKLIVPAAWTGNDTVTFSGNDTFFDIGTGNMVKDAGLMSVLGQSFGTPSAGSGNGSTTGTEITWSVINVANTVTEVATGDIVPAANSTAKLYSNADFDANEDQPIALSEGGETTAYIKVEATDTGTIRYHKVRINRVAAPTYTIAMIGNQTLTALTEGYDAGTQQTKTITITRTGTGDLASLATALSGANEDSFTITQPSATTLNSGTPSATFTVKANDGLAAGTYTATITITATNMTNQTFTVTQVVNADGSSTYTISADTTPFDFGSVTEGYSSAPAGQMVTITNTGNQTITLTEPSTTNASSNYNFASLSDTILDAGETATFAIRPKDGLAVGTYNETINIAGSNSAAASISARFSVTSAGGSGGGGGGSSKGSTEPLVTKIESGASVVSTNIDKLVQEGKKLTVEGKAGEKLVFDTEALKNIDGQAKDSVKVEIKDVSTNYKNEHPDRLVVSLTITAGGKHITNFGNGTATVSLPYELKEGEKAEDVTVWYLAEDGTMTEVPCTYDANAKLATFKVNHFSLYVVGTADTSKWTNPFSDVKESSWFYDAVRYVSANGLMNGTTDTAFNPGAKTTRGMIVTILWRMENEPKASKEMTFTDVKNGKYYHDAVAWASEKGIVGGYSAEQFGPEDNITREQLAVILHKYAATKGHNTSASGDLSAFGDSGNIHSWSKDAMIWAGGNGLIKGSENNLLDPAGAAQRSQVAAILQRFVESTAK